MLVYHYDEETKEFLYEEEASIDPLETGLKGENVYLLPANATFEKPLEKQDYKAVVFNGETWEYIEDYRGVTVWKSYYESMVIEELGAIPDGYSLEQPEMTEEEKREELNMLNMTRGDFIEGLILAQGKDETDIIARIKQLPITDMEKKVYINRVKNALDFYRGYPVIDVLCNDLGVTTEQMDLFFKTKDYKHLIPIEAEDENTTSVQEDTEL